MVYFQALRDAIAADEIGEVMQVVAAFGGFRSRYLLFLHSSVVLPGFANQDTPRIHKKELGGGTVLDLGIYLVQLAQLVFGGEEPQQVASRRLQLRWSGCCCAGGGGGSPGARGL